MKSIIKKPDYLIISIGLLFLLLLVDTFILIFLAITLNNTNSGKQFIPGSGMSFVNPYSGCKEVGDNCLSKDCSLYYLCDGFNDMKNCTIYDCGDNYGIVAQSQNDVFETKTYAKPDEKQVYENAAQCKGKLEILNKKCVSDISEVSVKVLTQGNCQINNFLVDMGDKNYKKVVFEKKENVYNLTINSCNFSEIIAVGGKYGVTIK